MTKRCPGCKEEKPLVAFSKDGYRADGLHGYCKNCVNNFNKEYYEANREREVERQRVKRAREKDQAYAHRALCCAIEAGKIARASECEVCGRKRHIQAYHEDYKKPLEVKWLCPSCHHNLHARIIKPAVSS